MNPDKFRNTNAYVDLAKFEWAVGKELVTNFEFQIKTNRSKACMTKLMMEKAYYLHIRRLFPKIRLLHGHRLRDGARSSSCRTRSTHGRGEPERRHLFDAAGKSKDPEREPERSWQRRAKAIGQLG